MIKPVFLAANVLIYTVGNFLQADVLIYTVGNFLPADVLIYTVGNNRCVTDTWYRAAVQVFMYFIHTAVEDAYYKNEQIRKAG